MKISDDMLFPHPVLSPFSDDYHDSAFTADFTVNLENADLLAIEATITLKCPDLDQLIEEGAAGCGFFVVGRRTYQNRLLEMTPGTATHLLNAHHFFGTLELRPVIWSRESRQDWTSRFLHPEYGGRVSFPAASLLATAPEQRFSVDRERLRPFESIFALSARDDLEAGEIAVNPAGDKIEIVVLPAVKESIDAIRNDVRGRAVLLNSVYFPAVMHVLSELAAGEASYEHHAWHRIFMAKCAHAGVDPAGGDALAGAQRLLRFPFRQLDEQKEKLFA